eukprot:gene5792-4151_t
MKRTLLGLIVVVLGVLFAIAEEAPATAATNAISFLEPTKATSASTGSAAAVPQESKETAPSTGAIQLLDVAATTAKQAEASASPVAVAATAGAVEMLDTNALKTAVATAATSTASMPQAAAPAPGTVQLLDVAAVKTAAARASPAASGAVELLDTNTVKTAPSAAAVVTQVPSATVAQTTAAPVATALPTQTEAAAPVATVAASPAAPLVVPTTNSNNEHILTQEIASLHQLAFQQLHRVYTADHAEAQKHPFDDVLVSYPVAPSLALTSIPDKFLVAPNALRQHAQTGVIYAAGIATHPQFEVALAAMGLNVHAFDCTLPSAPHLEASGLTAEQQAFFHFHPWCLGSNPSLTQGSTEYTKKSHNSSFTFHSLQETTRMLQHGSQQAIDVLKLDIEGYEWDLLEREILRQIPTTTTMATAVAAPSTAVEAPVTTSATTTTATTAAAAAAGSSAASAALTAPVTAATSAVTTDAAPVAVTASAASTTPTANGAIAFLDMTTTTAATAATAQTAAAGGALEMLDTQNIAGQQAPSTATATATAATTTREEAPAVAAPATTAAAATAAISEAATSTAAEDKPKMEHKGEQAHGHSRSSLGGFGVGKKRTAGGERGERGGAKGHMLRRRLATDAEPAAQVQYLTP